MIEGPEVEHDYYNFTALNHPPGHPARRCRTPSTSIRGPSRRASSTSDGLPPGPTDVLLRTHTSPMQVRAMEDTEPAALRDRPRDASTAATHRRDPHADVPPGRGARGRRAASRSPTCRGRCSSSRRALFGPDRETRLRPDYFPFTEPSVEVDVSCFACDGSGRLAGGGRDPLCKGTGWIEILGAGMVDPNVFGFVARARLRPRDDVQGFAFGMGIERIAMLKHGVPDLRLFFENDVRFLGQFA